MFFSRTLSTTKLKQSLQHLAKLYKQIPCTGSSIEKEKFKTDLYHLEALIQSGDRKEATLLSKSLDQRASTLFPKPMWKKAVELTLALAVALVLATIVRQMWFEPFQIPTGSMRPTFRELDLLTVTKTPYAINVPVQTEHFYFNENDVQRGSVLIFSGDKLDLPDVDSTFLYVFPYTKRYIKRLIGKPGDTLIFYGGSLYGFDKEGNKITDFENADWKKKLEYIPFITFEGKIQQTNNSTIKFKQMNQEVGRLTFSPVGDLKGEVFNGKEWVKDDPSKGESLSDLWGIGNFGKARILSKEEVNLLGLSPKTDAPFYLEINHHPSFSKVATTQEVRGFQLNLVPQKSLLPLDQEHMNRIMDNLYTARFVVKNEQGARYDMSGGRFNAKTPTFNNVPDGTYEFYYGKGYNVNFGGFLTDLSPNSPLMSRDPLNIQKLFNLGIEFDLSYSPRPKNNLLPTRFAYFKNGDLYVMGGPVFTKDEPALKEFVQEESKKGALGFVDHIEEIQNPEYIKKHGLKIPEKHYLVLGDNHAMSGDSRIFGFVPEENLQGAPSLILWPFNDRFGTPNMRPYPLFTPSRLIVWALGFSSLGLWWYLRRKKLNKPLDL